jgi:hypothetical protein
MATNNCETCADTTNLPATPACPPATPCPPRLCAPQEWSCGGWLYKELDGCTTRTRLAGVLPDGVYQNATITMTNGCISAVTNGTNILQSRPEPCATGAGSVTPVANITISPAPCNLLSGTASALFAGIVFNQAGQNITVTGCGNTASPAVLSYNGGASLSSITSATLQYTVSPSGAVSINTQGANYSKCGTVIESGIVKSYSDTIKTIISGRGISAIVDSSNCSITIASSDSSKNFIGVSCGGVFVNPSTGSPPINATWQMATASVHGNRLFVETPIAGTVYIGSGTVLGNSPLIITYGSNALALAAMDSITGWSGLGSC